MASSPASLASCVHPRQRVQSRPMIDTAIYQATLDYLYTFVDYSLVRNFRNAPGRFDLARMAAFAAALGNPHKQYPIIHVAGTKGKGSISALCASALQAGGYRTGLYTSPHIVELRERILEASAATLDRLLAPCRAAVGGRGRCGTRPGTLLRGQIPIRTEHWDVEGPGYIEADTVAHCGESMAGEFCWSLTATDVHTQWTETRAVANRLIFFDQGQIVEEGTHQEIFNNPKSERTRLFLSQILEK